MEDSDLTRVTERTERVGKEQAKDKSPAASRTAGLFHLWIEEITLKSVGNEHSRPFVRPPL
jgi:hypothetical protein